LRPGLFYQPLGSEWGLTWMGQTVDRDRSAQRPGRPLMPPFVPMHKPARPAIMVITRSQNGTALMICALVLLVLAALSAETDRAATNSITPPWATTATCIAGQPSGANVDIY
jgi:hypothetical protein